MSKTQNKGIIEYPDFDEIKKRAIKKIDQMYIKYENSWKDSGLTLQWWKERLLGELNEIFDSEPRMNVEKRISLMTGEILDLIIVACMFYDRVTLVKCSKCGKHIVQWQILNGKPHCRKCYFES